MGIPAQAALIEYGKAEQKIGDERMVALDPGPVLLAVAGSARLGSSATGHFHLPPLKGKTMRHLNLICELQIRSYLARQ